MAAETVTQELPPLPAGYTDAPFPPLPPEFKASSLRVHFGFEFQPGQG